MRKFILAFVLSLITIVFGVFIYNTFILQKNYFNTTKVDEPTENSIVEEIKDIPSLYKEYSKTDYDTAIKNKEVIVLFFTSNWCTECSNQNKINVDLFKELNISGTLGLNIHILDSETTIETDSLAKKFDVVKENTYVILDRSGAVSSKYTGSIPKDQLKNNIMKAGDSK